MPAPMLKVGEITVIPLSDGGFTPPPSGFMPSVPVEAWNDPEAKQYLTPEGNVPLNFGMFLLVRGGSYTLVDAGVGGRGGGMPPGKLPGELEKAKVSPDQIERVLITHLHLDHIGWCTVDREGKPETLFKNARHIVQRKEWEYWTQEHIKKDNPVIGLCAEPVHAQGLVDLVDGDVTVAPGISSLFTPGHTPGHQAFLINSGGEKAIIMGDVTHSMAQLEHTDWNPGFDVDPATSQQTRAQVFDRIEREGLKVCAGHYPYPSIGTIVRVEGKRRWQGI